MVRQRQCFKTNLKCGLTVVEVAVAVTLIAAVVIGISFYLRRSQLAELKAIADVEPWKVFKLSAAPSKEAFHPNEEVIVHLEVFNPMRYDLELKWEDISFVFPELEQGQGFWWQIVASFDADAQLVEDMLKSERPNGEKVDLIKARKSLFFRLKAPPAGALQAAYEPLFQSKKDQFEVAVVLYRRFPGSIDTSNPPSEFPRIMINFVDENATEVSP